MFEKNNIDIYCIILSINSIIKKLYFLYIIKT